MDKKTIIILVLVFVGSFLTLFFKGGSKTATLPVQSQIDTGSVLTAENRSYNFGIISMQDGTVSVTFAVSNETERDLRIDSIVTSCMCTTAFISDEGGKRGPFGMPGHGNVVPRANEIIRAGEEKMIEIIFDPAAHGPEGAGSIERYVYLVDEEGGALELEIKAMVTL